MMTISETMIAAIASHTHRVSGYGVFLGGDPRDFRPDPDSSAERTRRLHRIDCERVARGKRPLAGAYGLGSYELDMECNDPECPQLTYEQRERIRAALADEEGLAERLRDAQPARVGVAEP